MGRTFLVNLCPTSTHCRLFKMICVQTRCKDNGTLGTGIFMTVPWPTILWPSFALEKPHTAGIRSETTSVEAAVAEYGMVNEDEGHSMVWSLPSHEEEDDSLHLAMFFCPVPQLD